jgi:hypothetical protein
MKPQFAELFCAETRKVRTFFMAQQRDIPNSEALAIDVTDESTPETPRRITPLRGLKFCRGGALAG